MVHHNEQICASTRENAYLKKEAGHSPKIPSGHWESFGTRHIANQLQNLS